jgi:hypothetical protein
LFNPASLAQLSALSDPEGKLLDVVLDATASDALRFVAASALFEGGWTTWRGSERNRAAVADALVRAMRADRSHNRWGMPRQFIGPYGRRLLSLGAAAATSLRDASADDSLLSIEGSEASTLQEARRHRVADLANYLLAELTG